MISKLLFSIQSYLAWKGFNPGPIDGQEGPLTSAAWNAFLDKEEGEEIPIVIGPDTPRALPVGDAPVVSDTDKVVTGRATVFGLDYNGNSDPSDNGVGAWGAHTANKTIVGVSLPEGVMLSTFGFTGTWAHNASSVGRFLRENKIQVAVTRNGQTEIADVCDAGPARQYKGKLLHNAIDLTYALAHKLETNGDAIVSYQILKDNQPMVIKGWDRLNGCEIAQAGVA